MLSNKLYFKIMNLKRIFIRNVQSRRQLNAFIISAITAVISIRYYLHLTNYPQIGGDSLHIAHMLWGGLLMMTALILLLAYMGRRLQLLAAIAGGAGFGIFIDEVGKFLTKDNDYFFRPAIGIIYAIFVLMYLAIVWLSRQSKLDNQTAQLNALNQLEEAVVRDMDRFEKRRVLDLLDQAKQHDALTKHLRELTAAVTVVRPNQPSRFERAYRWLGISYHRLWARRNSSRFVQAFFVIEAVLFMAALVFALVSDITNGRVVLAGPLDYGRILVIGQLISASVAAVTALVGAILLLKSRIQGLNWFRYSIWINLFITEFFYFSRVEFTALGSFVFNLIMLLLVSFALNQERRKS